MESAVVYQKLTAVFHDVFDAEDVRLTDATTAEDVDGWDSLNHIRLIFSVQKAFGVKFSATDIGKIKNVGELVALIQSKAA